MHIILIIHIKVASSHSKCISNWPVHTPSVYQTDRMHIKLASSHSKSIYQTDRMHIKVASSHSQVYIKLTTCISNWPVHSTSVYQTYHALKTGQFTHQVHIKLTMYIKLQVFIKLTRHIKLASLHSKCLSNLPNTPKIRNGHVLLTTCKQVHSA